MTDFSIEKSIDGPVIGLDEVGRGPLAGPVVSCGCYFSNYDNLESEIPITDSKKHTCLLYTSPSPRDTTASRMPSSA